MNTFYRDTENQVLGGVIAGFSDLLKIDVTLLRVIYFIAALRLEFFALLYILLWVFAPEKPHEDSSKQAGEEPSIRDEGRSIRKHRKGKQNESKW